MPTLSVGLQMRTVCEVALRRWETPAHTVDRKSFPTASALLRPPLRCRKQIAFVAKVAKTCRRGCIFRRFCRLQDTFAFGCRREYANPVRRFLFAPTDFRKSPQRAQGRRQQNTRR